MRDSEREPLRAREDNEKRMNNHESASDRMGEQVWSGLKREWASGKAANYSWRCYVCGFQLNAKKGQGKKGRKKDGGEKGSVG